MSQILFFIIYTGSIELLYLSSKYFFESIDLSYEIILLQLYVSKHSR